MNVKDLKQKEVYAQRIIDDALALSECQMRRCEFSGEMLVVHHQRLALGSQEPTLTKLDDSNVSEAE